VLICFFLLLFAQDTVDDDGIASVSVRRHHFMAVPRQRSQVDIDHIHHPLCEGDCMAYAVQKITLDSSKREPSAEGSSTAAA
jgi:hypothetical protein